MKRRDKFKFGSSSIRRMCEVSEYLQLAAQRTLICSPIDVGVPWMGGLRLATDQNGIFKDGHSSCDGYEKISYHQQTDDKGKGLAIDLVPYIPNKGLCYDAHGRFGVIGMLMLESWEELQDEGLIPKHLYLHWGGLWSHKDPKKLGWDLAHFEIRDKPQKERV